jgi:hydrogenase maturation factor
MVAVGNALIEVDISLVDDIAPGDHVLIHGGVAIGKL